MNKRERESLVRAYEAFRRDDPGWEIGMRILQDLLRRSRKKAKEKIPERREEKP